MNKILAFIFSLFFLFSFNSTSAEIIADKIYATSVENVNVEGLKKDQKIHLYAIQDHELGKKHFIEEKSELTFKIHDIIEKKRGKRNEYLKVELISFTVPSKNNEIIHCTENSYKGTIRNSTPKDLKEVSKKAGITIVGKVLKIPVFSQVVATSKGIIKPNENQTRLQSAGTNLYKSTPLTYFERGQSLNLEENTIVVIKLKEKDREED